jgi:wobble nucleotide-excising tRNase
MINQNPWFLKILLDEGLDKNVSSNFQKFTQSKIEPLMDLKKGMVSFNIYTGDSETKRNVKISRGEESIFVWSVFYTLLENAIETLNASDEDRLTDFFNDLNYIVIDDPFSSIDDTKLINSAVELISTIKGSENSQLKFLITTHHALFYNILFNSFRRQDRRIYSRSSHILSRVDNNALKLKPQGDSPFGYHLLLKNEIEDAIDNNNVQKYHFNQFRIILEKTANFLGRKDWRECIVGDYKSEFIRLLDMHSHGRISDLEYKELSEENKQLFKKAFNNFLKEHNWKVN